MVYCPEGHKDKVWKHEPGYFYWVRWNNQGRRGYRYCDPLDLSEVGILCLCVIPPGEQSLALLPVEPCPEELNGGVSWQWNGSTEKPTLKPSVDGTSGGKYPNMWHGFITDGIMT